MVLDHEQTVDLPNPINHVLNSTLPHEAECPFGEKRSAPDGPLLIYMATNR